MGIPGAVVFSAKKAWQQKNPRKKPLKSEKNLGKKPKVFKQEKNTRISSHKKRPSIWVRKTPESKLPRNSKLEKSWELAQLGENGGDLPTFKQENRGFCSLEIK